MSSCATRFSGAQPFARPDSQRLGVWLAWRCRRLCTSWVQHHGAVARWARNLGSTNNDIERRAPFSEPNRAGVHTRTEACRPKAAALHRTLLAHGGHWLRPGGGVHVQDASSSWSTHGASSARRASTSVPGLDRAHAPVNPAALVWGYGHRRHLVRGVHAPARKVQLVRSTGVRLVRSTTVALARSCGLDAPRRCGNRDSPEWLCGCAGVVPRARRVVEA